MALNNNFLPTTNLVFTPRDFASDLQTNQSANSKGISSSIALADKFRNLYKENVDRNINRKVAKELNSENPNVNTIDALNASRYNNPDTMGTMWRWKQGQDQQKAQFEADLARIEAEKQKQEDLAREHLQYKIDAQLKPMQIGMTTSPEDLKQWRNTLASLESEALANKVGQDYLDKIYQAQSQFGENTQLPSHVAQQYAQELNNLDTLWNIKQNEGGLGQNKDAWNKEVDRIWMNIQNLYGQYGAPVPIELQKLYFAKANKLAQRVPPVYSTGQIDAGSL